MSTPDQDASERIQRLLADISLELGALRTRDAAQTAVATFLQTRRVAGAHGYGYRR